jgi:hypothetical protein
MKKTQYQSYSAIVELFASEKLSDSLISESIEAIRFLREGESIYRRTHAADEDASDRFSHALNKINDIRRMAEEMFIKKEEGLKFAQEQIVINVTPYIEFMGSASYHEHLQDFNQVKNVMSQILSENNIIAYRKAYELIERFVYHITFDMTEAA